FDRRTAIPSPQQSLLRRKIETGRLFRLAAVAAEAVLHQNRTYLGKKRGSLGRLGRGRRPKPEDYAAQPRRADPRRYPNRVHWLRQTFINFRTRTNRLLLDLRCIFPPAAACAEARRSTSGGSRRRPSPAAGRRSQTRPWARVLSSAGSH